MIEKLESLGLDASRIKRQRDACIGLSHAYLTDSKSRQDGADLESRLFAAGTNLRRAAANSLLLDDTEQARHLFDQAAATYLAVDAPYGAFVEMFGNRELRSKRRFAEVPASGSDVWRLWSPDALLYDVSMQREWTLSFRRQLDAYRMERVGVLGLPAAVYLDVFDFTILHETDAEHRIGEALLPLLGAYAAALRRCRTDQYHWTRLAMPFHPIEPDVIGVALAIGEWLRARQRSVSRVIMALPIGSDALTLVRETLRQYGVWEEE